MNVDRHRLQRHRVKPSLPCGHDAATAVGDGLDDARLIAQITEIRALNKKWKGDFKLFAGSEVDIHKDGTLDFTDEILAQLDYVVASVHAVFNLPEAEMTKRIIKASTVNSRMPSRPAS